MSDYTDLTTVDHVVIDEGQNIPFGVDGLIIQATTTDGHTSAEPAARVILPLRVGPFNRSDDQGRPLPPLKLLLTAHQSRRLAELLIASIVQIEYRIEGVDIEQLPE